MSNTVVLGLKKISELRKFVNILGVENNMSNRIGNIEYRDKNNKEIVYWYPNPYYGRENDYNWTDDGQFAYKEDIRCRVHKSCFENNESCYVLAFVRENKDDEPDIQSVGSRVVRLDENDLRDYIEVVKKIFGI